MTTPAAAPAAPAAAPAAPAPASAPAPAAPAAALPAAPAAPAAPPAAPAPAAVDSLLPADAPAAAAPAQTEAERLAAARELVKQADAAADPNSGKAWLLHEGVMGQGEKPAWFKQDKYKTVAAQAEAYVSLESRFGAFKGAPKNEKGEVAYAFKPPEGVEFKADHPMAVEFTKWATENQLSQEGYDQLLGQLIQYELAQQPDMNAIKGRLGDNADTRIAQVAQWGKANLGAEGYATLRAATSGPNADAVFKVLEQVISKTGQVRMPKPGVDVPAATGGTTLAQIQAMQAEKGPDGKRLFVTSEAHRRKVEKAYTDYYAGQGA